MPTSARRRSSTTSTTLIAHMREDEAKARKLLAID